MIVALSRFRVVNAMEEQVAAAFRDRPHRVEQAPGFLGLEVFRDVRHAGTFYLLTRWTEEKSFRDWHGSEEHRSSHAGIPSGLRLDPAFTEVVALERIEGMDEGPHRVADTGLLLSAFLERSRGVLLLECAADGTILACNPAVEELLGVPAAALAGRPLWDHVTEPDANRLQARLAAAARRPEERFRFNVCDASYVPHTLECQVDLRPGGFVLVGEREKATDQRFPGELLALNNDLAVIARERAQALARAQRSEQDRERLLASEREVREDAEAANRRKDHLLAVVSHDLRGPLNAIIGWAQLLKQDRQGRVDVGRAVDAIQRNAETQAKLIEDLLDLARTTAGQIRLNLRPTDPSKLVEAVLDTVRLTAEAKGVLVESAGPGGEPLVVMADPARLEQALGNLVGNAVKFTPRDGRVEVRLAAEEDSVAIRVRDTGEGIDPELLPHLFEPFRQGPGAESAAGVGLGLTIARNLIELQGGTVQATSEGPGKGAVFTVRLPRHRIEPPPAYGAASS